MAAVRHEAKAPPPIPFPWTRAAPGIAAALLVIALTVASFVTTSGAESPTGAPVALERVIEISASIGNAVAGWDARNATIWVVVLALSAVPLLAPLMVGEGSQKRPAYKPQS